MFVHHEKEKSIHPIKIWLDNINTVEDLCIEQAVNLSNLPFIHKWVSLMPDTHVGNGMPIGGVIACDGVVVPNAVGVDIGCGMGFIQTNVPAKLLREIMTGNGLLLQAIIGDILRNIPTGFNHHKKAQESIVLDRAMNEIEKYKVDNTLIPQINDGYYQIGTLGGGNHFIELQEDENGMVGIMLHSGSRHFGNEIGKYFNQIASMLNSKWYSNIPNDYKLPFLPVDSNEGQQYINWMQLAMDFAYENREKMMDKVKEIFTKYLKKYAEITPAYDNEINCHHNYAVLEHHYEKDVWVHRKGAVRAGEGEIGIIPGAMGSNSYIVRGKGNPESFCSSSHGAGRNYSRRGAMEAFSVETVMNDLKASGVVLGKHNKKDVPEESRFAYKDIDFVMSNQKDLVEPIKKLFTIGVVKG